MKFYSTVDEMWSDCVCDLLSHGERIDSRDGPCREQLAFEATLVDPSMCLLADTRRNIDPCYASAELLWYLSETADIEFIERFASQYRRFAPSGKAFGAYGRRIGEHRQLDKAVQLLKSDASSRQCVIAMWHPLDLNAAVCKQLDIPCTLSLQLLLRDDRLHMICTMRSNDVWLGMPYDVFCFCSLQRLLAWELGVGLGYYHHRAGSAHLYDRDAKKAEHDGGIAETLQSWYGRDDTIAGSRVVARCVVRRVVRRVVGHDANATVSDGTMSVSLALTCAAKFSQDIDLRRIDQPLRAALERRSRARGG